MEGYEKVDLVWSRDCMDIHSCTVEIDWCTVEIRQGRRNKTLMGKGWMEEAVSCIGSAVKTFLSFTVLTVCRILLNIINNISLILNWWRWCHNFMEVYQCSEIHCLVTTRVWFRLWSVCTLITLEVTSLLSLTFFQRDRDIENVVKCLVNHLFRVKVKLKVYFNKMQFNVGT